MNEHELYHYGVKGMKWGVRRAALKETSNISNSSSNIARRMESRRAEKRRSRINVSKMSDQELRQRINRMNMERQYKDLKMQEKRNGQRYASDILATMGDVAAVGASIATIVLAYKKLKD